MGRANVDLVLAALARGDRFHVTDTETTGLSPRRCRVIELATVTLEGGRIVDRFETLIDPGVAIPREITRLTGITTTMVAGAPAAPEALGRWFAYLGGEGHFVAHNADFDRGFLAEECRRAGRPWPFPHAFCTVQLARRGLPGLRSYSLGNLVSHLGIRVDGTRHRAMVDVECTAEVFLRVASRLQGADEPPAPLEAPPGWEAAVDDPWSAVLAGVRAKDVPFAALLMQQGRVATWAPGERLVVTLPPIFARRVNDHPRRLALLADVAAAVGGSPTAVTITEPPCA